MRMAERSYTTPIHPDTNNGGHCKTNSKERNASPNWTLRKHTTSLFSTNRHVTYQRPSIAPMASTVTRDSIMEPNLPRISSTWRCIRRCPGFPNQVNIANYILIGGAVEEHDAALQKVLSALTSNGITVNPDKCVFDVEEVQFVGLVFKKHGIKPRPEKCTESTRREPTHKQSRVALFSRNSRF